MIFTLSYPPEPAHHSGGQSEKDAVSTSEARNERHPDDFAKRHPRP